MAVNPERSWSVYDGKRVFVTGADGFIGSHLVEGLIGAGASVTALVYYNAFDRLGWLDELSEEHRRHCRIILGDIRDGHFIMEALKGHDLVFHLAALIGIPFSYAAPASYVDTNVRGTLNVLEAARVHGVERFIHTSTSEVYGTAVDLPISETHALQAQSPYAATKIAADMLAESYFKSFSLPVVILRPFNTYGPRQGRRAVIPTIITQLLFKAPVLRLGKLTPTRDFNYVHDTVNAFLQIGRSGTIRLGETYNAGSGCEVGIGEVALLIQKVMGVQVSIEEDDDRLRPQSSEVMRLQADATKFTKATGWNPRVRLEEGLQRTVRWWLARSTSQRADLTYRV